MTELLAGVQAIQGPLFAFLGLIALILLSFAVFRAVTGLRGGSDD